MILHVASILRATCMLPFMENAVSRMQVASIELTRLLSSGSDTLKHVSVLLI